MFEPAGLANDRYGLKSFRQTVAIVASHEREGHFPIRQRCSDCIDRAAVQTYIEQRSIEAKALDQVAGLIDRADWPLDDNAGIFERRDNVQADQWFIFHDEEATTCERTYIARCPGALWPHPRC